MQQSSTGLIDIVEFFIKPFVVLFLLLLGAAYTRTA